MTVENMPPYLKKKGDPCVESRSLKEKPEKHRHSHLLLLLLLHKDINPLSSASRSVVRVWNNMLEGTESALAAFRWQAASGGRVVCAITHVAFQGFLGLH